MKEEIKQETLDICVIARFRDKEIAMEDLLKVLFDENEKLRKALDKIKEYIKENGIVDLNGYDLLKIIDGEGNESN